MRSMMQESLRRSELVKHGEFFQLAIGFDQESSNLMV